MQCYNPRVGFRRFDASRIKYTRVSWSSYIKRGSDVYALPELRKLAIANSGRCVDFNSPLKVPCSKCDACHMNKARDLATRCMMEFHSVGGVGIFLTLTYSDEFLPRDRKYCEKHVEDFMKRLRRRCPRIRSLGVAEYGERTRRPHYHLLIFGWEPFDREKVGVSDASHAGESYDIFQSKLLTEVWTFGKHEFGSITEQSCSYVARYTQKKVGDKNGYYKAKTICRSRRPGLGAKFTDDFGEGISNAEAIMLRGAGGDVVSFPIPRYVHDRLRKRSEEVAARLLASRQDFEASRDYYEESKERVYVKKVIFEQRISKLKRNL